MTRTVTPDNQSHRTCQQHRFAMLLASQWTGHVSRLNVKYNGSNLLLVLLVLLTASPGVLAQSTEDVVTAYIEADNSAVVAFLPPSMHDSQDKGAAVVQAAIENTKLCLGEDDVSYQVVFAERIVVRSLGREETFEVGHFAPLVGVLLLRPGWNARLLFAGGGPEALTQMLRSAASEYFGKRCKAG